jgi:hypothetical protein
MNIAMISNSGKDISLKLYDETLKELANETFEDVYTLNFYLQTIPRNFGQKKTLLIYTKSENSNQRQDGANIHLSIAEDENSYFISE